MCEVVVGVVLVIVGSEVVGVVLVTVGSIF